jgi:DNA-binding LytR/AlgR family response regulator
MTDPFNILIVEDEELFANKIEMQVEKLGHTIIGIVNNSESALKLVDIHHVDLILMDIFIDGQYDGIELAEMIQVKKDIAVLFITSQHDEMSFKRATRSGPVGFLLKPFSDMQLQRSIELALSQIEPSEIEEQSASDISNIKQDCFFIKKKQKISKVNYSDIFYIKSDGRYCRLHTEQEMYLIRKSMKDLKLRLPNEMFVQCHRSYLVNLAKVKSVDLENDYVILQEMKIPLARREKDNLLGRLDYL